VVPKKNGKKRSIHSNTEIQTGIHHHRDQATNQERKDDKNRSKERYFHVPIHKKHQTYLERKILQVHGPTVRNIHNFLLIHEVSQASREVLERKRFQIGVLRGLSCFY
jgi:hypothetical protein